MPATDPGELASKVASARKAQARWAQTDFRERAVILRSVRDQLVNARNEVASLVSREVGKPEFEALALEVLPLANLIDYFSRKSQSFLKPDRFSLSVFRNKRSEISYEPLGVVGIISPWNFPLSIPGGQMAMALMAGNAILFKPSELSTWVGRRLVDLFIAGGIPSELIQFVPGGRAVGEAMVPSGIDKIFFTGSSRVGREIAVQAAHRLIPSVLELGGKDAMIVCEDASLDRAVNGALWGAFANAGQACASVERLYVMESIAAEFEEKLLQAAQSLRVNRPDSPDWEVGNLVSVPQLHRVLEQFDDAISGGAVCSFGGRPARDGGTLFPPTILKNVRPEMKIMKEETFGPILPVCRVKDDQEALKAVNDSNYGLLASIWTKNLDRGLALARQIEAGTVLVNDVMYTHGAAETPWGGRKESGWGVAHSRHGLMEFVRLKHINWDRLPLKSNLWWFPYTSRKRSLVDRLIVVLHKWGLKRWV